MRLEMRKVLIVHHNEDMRHLLAHWLERLSCDTFYAKSGEEGLESLKAFGSRPPFDAAVISYERLGSRTAEEFIKAAKIITPSLRVVVVTTISPDFINVTARLKDLADFVIGPLINFDAMRMAITRLRSLHR